MNKENKKTTDIRRAWRFENTFRFIDNLTVLNDGGEFERSYNKIDPPELQRKKKKIAIQKVPFIHEYQNKK